MTTNKTVSQKLRSAARENGRFYANPCNCCRRGAPMDHFSDPRCDDHGGFGVVLCKRCAVKLGDVDDATFAQVAAFAFALNSF